MPIDKSVITGLVRRNGRAFRPVWDAVSCRLPIFLYTERELRKISELERVPEHQAMKKNPPRRKSAGIRSKRADAAIPGVNPTTPQPADPEHTLTFQIVGIGSSAGGIGALSQLFTAVQSDTAWRSSSSSTWIPRTVR